MSQDFKQSIKKPPEAANRKYSLLYLFEGHLSKNNGNWAGPNFPFTASETMSG